jgi:hypothetical protein
MKTELGKIQKAYWGLGGYQDCQIGLSLVFSMKGAGVSTFIGAWATKRTNSTQWTEVKRLAEIGAAGMKCVELLNATGKLDVASLAGTPVELTFDGNVLAGWRLLDEVL